MSEPIDSSDQFPIYKYQGAKAAIRLHEHLLKNFLSTWKSCKASGVPLPQTKDPNYNSYENLLRHVLWNAREYMVWICEKLELPDPKIDQTPDPEVIEKEADLYVHHLIRQWRKPLAEVGRGRFLDFTYKSRWLTHYCIDAMLEHAALHPLRHQFQLEQIMGTTESQPVSPSSPQ